MGRTEPIVSARAPLDSEIVFGRSLGMQRQLLANLRYDYWRSIPDRVAAFSLMASCERSAKINSLIRRSACRHSVRRGHKPGVLALLGVRDHPIHDFHKGNRWPESRELFQLGKRWDPPRHIFEARLIGLIVWHEYDCRTAFRPLFHQMCELLDRDLLISSDIHDLADGLLRSKKADNRFDRVTDIAKAAR